MSTARPRHVSLAALLALAFIALVAYASLYPFEGWQWPQGNPKRLALLLPWSRYYSSFDNAANLVGYMPMGALVFVAQIRRGWRIGPAWLLGVLGPSALSYLFEFLQQLLPTRVSSVMDWITNTTGALLGASLGLMLVQLGFQARWEAWRERWFVERSAGSVLLLVLWPFGLLFPAPVPLGLGQVLDRARELVLVVLEGTPLEAWADRSGLADPLLQQPLGVIGETAAIAFGLLAPCLLVYSITRTGWRRAVLAAGAVAIGVSVTTLSTALLFGPDHALAWFTPQTLPGLTTGTLAALALVWLPRRAAAALGLVVGTALIALVTQAPDDAYFAASLQAWEQGRFIRFNGVAQWVGWLWPYAMLLVLLVRVSGRDSP